MSDDVKDAARYRWLREQFEAYTEERTWEELVWEKGDEKTYRTVREYSYCFHLVEDWRFCGVVPNAVTPDFETVVDKLMLEYSERG